MRLMPRTLYSLFLNKKVTFKVTNDLPKAKETSGVTSRREEEASFTRSMWPTSVDEAPSWSVFLRITPIVALSVT